MRFCLVLLAFAGAASPALAQSVELGGEGVNLAMRLSAEPAPEQGSSPQVSSQADLTGQLSSLKTQVQLGVDAGQPDLGWWNSTSAGVSAAWSPTEAASFEFGAQKSSRVEFTDSDPVFADSSQHYAESRRSGLTAAATLTPTLGALPPVDLKLGAEARSSVQQDAWLDGAGGQTGDLTQVQTRRVSAMLGLSPLSGVKLEAGGQMQSMGLVWSAGRAVTEASLEPSAKLSAAPWSGGSLKLTLDRAVSPLSADQFIGYGHDAVQLAGVQPSREWRYGAALAQKMGPLDFKASILAARVESFAYLAPAETMLRSGPARIGLGSGDRSEVSAGFGAPLALPGLSPFALEARATWRASAVQDPLTGALGRLSGERPYDASLSLSQAVGSRIRWGMTAEAGGPQTNFGPSQTASLSSTTGLGGFLQYSAKPVTVRLSLDNILGGEREERDVFYAGSRDLNQIDRVGEIRTVDRGIRLSLSRPL
jgi:hypothetical protein